MGLLLWFPLYHILALQYHKNRNREQSPYGLLYHKVGTIA